MISIRFDLSSGRECEWMMQDDIAIHLVTHILQTVAGNDVSVTLPIGRFQMEHIGHDPQSNIPYKEKEVG